MIDICQNVVAIGDYNGRNIYIMNTSGLLGQITTNRPIRNFCVASNGVVAVVLDDSDLTYRYFFFILLFISKVIPNIHPMLSLITFITSLRLLYHTFKCQNLISFQQELRSNSWDADCGVCVYCIIYSNARILYHFNFILVTAAVAVFLIQWKNKIFTDSVTVSSIATTKPQNGNRRLRSLRLLYHIFN